MLQYAIRRNEAFYYLRNCETGIIIVKQVLFLIKDLLVIFLKDRKAGIFTYFWEAIDLFLVRIRRLGRIRLWAVVLRWIP